MSSSDNNTATSDVVRNAWQSYRDGDPSEAERCCRSALESNPDAADIIYLLGILEFDKKNYTTAIELFTRATILDPDDARSFTYLGIAYSMAGDSAKAVEACDRAIVLNPELAEAHFQLGLIYQAQDKPEEARASYRSALEYDPENPGIHDALGTLFHKSGRFEEAIDSYRKGLALNPESASLHNNLGSALQQRGGLDEANAEYRMALELDPHYIQAQMNLADLCEERGDAQQAVRTYQQIIRMHPRHGEAHGNLGRILLDAMKLEEARVCFENVLRIDSDDAEAHERLAEVFKEMGRIDLAIDQYRRASELGSVSAGHFLAALTHEDTQIAPRQYIEELFDFYSEDFEEHLVESLSYKSPGLLYEAFMRVNKGSGRFRSAIDLGCGTGLAGVAFQSIIEHLDGVDLSPEMLKQARRKGIYRNLDAADIVEYLNTSKRRYDLFIAADVLIYIGNLTPVFEAVKHSASSYAYFIFTIESTDDGDFVLQSTGRYAHSEEYIRSVARVSDFKVLRSNPVPLRKEDEQWVNGRMFVLKAGAGSMK